MRTRTRQGSATASAARAPRTNLPPDTPRLFGRDADLDALCALLDGHKLVTVVGAGGIGKSRLAQAAARRHAARVPDGAWMVELAGLSDPALIANEIARALALPKLGPGAAEELVTALAQRKLLLVLDNCEHLLDAVAAIVQALLHGAPDVTLLATSQEPLRLPQEQQYRVPPLAVPAQSDVAGAREFGAVALFEARVRAVDPRFTMSDEYLPLAIDICRRLDGLPLAVELAAARAGTLGLRTVHEKLDARFRLLTGGARTPLRRHQTLHAALEWSYNLLNADEQAVFRRLGVFAGGFAMEIAQQVAGDERLDEWAVLDHLSALVEKSLVVADPGDVPRYRLLESARAFALETLADGETTETLARHAHAMRRFLERVDGANLDGELRTDQYAALVLPELDNLRAAYLWASGDGNDPETALSLVAHAGSLIDHAYEWADWLAAAPPPAPDSGNPALAARYWRAITASNMKTRVAKARQIEAALRAMALYASLGQPRRVFLSLHQLMSHRLADDLAGAKAALDEARRLLLPDWPPELHIRMLRSDASVARKENRGADAVRLLVDSARLARAAGDWRLEVISRTAVVDTLWEIGTLAEAWQEAAALRDALRVRPAPHGDTATAYVNELGILCELDRIDDAAEVASRLLPAMRPIGEVFPEEWTYYFLRRGQLQASAQLLGAADALNARADGSRQPNEARLVAKARAGLVQALAPDELARHMAAGAKLSITRQFDVIGEALAEPGAPVA